MGEPHTHGSNQSYRFGLNPTPREDENVTGFMGTTVGRYGVTGPR